MRGEYHSSDHYVAPPEPPTSRRPPVATVGPLGWVRANLFSSPINSIATIVMAIILGGLLWLALDWSIRSAQWGVVFNNLRLITSGLYTRSEIWRVELIGALLVMLTGLSLGIWGYVSRGVFLTVAVSLAVILGVPLIGARIGEPTLYMLAEPERTPASLVFLGTQGDEVSFEIEPLTDLEAINARPLGYIENQSRTDWSTRAREARDGTLDLGAYNLHLTAALFRPDGSPVTRDGAPVRIAATPDDAGSTQTVELPRTGWYKLEVVRDDEANDENAGYAWVKVRGVELLPSQSELLAAREVEYGPRPTAARALLAEEAAYRYEGTRTFAEFISLQVAPFLSTIALEAVVGTALFLNGWVIGILGRRERRVRRTTLAAWVLSVPVILLLLGGIEGSRALPAVPSIQWGGLLLTMLLTVVGIAASFPLGVALALGRRSDLPVIKLVCTLFIETIRGVPLITILFMAKLIVPFFWVGLSDLDMTVRMMIGVTLFSAAYLAENVRGGLQIIPHGQIEAARALGMNPLLMTTLIVLPQALRAVIPAIVGQFISLFKDTSLVAVVGLFELVGIVDIIVSGQPIYRPYQREAYIFIALIYFVISYAMSDVSRRLEASGAGSVHARR